MYTITIHPRHRMMTVRLEGFWTAEILAAYLAELRREAKAMVDSGGMHRALIDMSSYPIQPKEIAAAHAQALLYARDRLGARVALVITSALSRLQAIRVARVSGNEVFDSRNAAAAWLMAA